MAKTPPRKTLTPDADLENADWLKGTWDLPIHSLTELKAYLKRTGTTPAAFKKLPVYTRNVETIPFLKFL